MLPSPPRVSTWMPSRRGGALADMAKRTSRRLVIDASVVQAAGPEGATFPTSKNCRDFLKAVLTVCHQVVLTPDIGDEWKTHLSRFSRMWRVSMEAKKKVYRPPGSVVDDELRAKISRAASSQEERSTLSKDTFLIEAALATDCAIAALDDTALRAFRKAANSVREIGRIVWVNPDKTDERPIAWLEKGARIERTRQVRPNR